VCQSVHSRLFRRLGKHQATSRQRSVEWSRVPGLRCILIWRRILLSSHGVWVAGGTIAIRNGHVRGTNKDDGCKQQPQNHFRDYLAHVRVPHRKKYHCDPSRFAQSGRTSAYVVWSALMTIGVVMPLGSIFSWSGVILMVPMSPMATVSLPPSARVAPMLVT